MEGVGFFATPTAEVFEGVRKSGDGRDNPNKLSWQVHSYIESFRPYIDGEVLGSAFTGWLMGFPDGWVWLDIEGDFSLSKE